jgi:hypothetical protein
LSAHQQILRLLGTWSYANDEGLSSRKMGGHMTYGLVGATPQVVSRFATSNHVHITMNQNSIARIPVRLVGLYGPRL